MRILRGNLKCVGFKRPALIMIAALAVTTLLHCLLKQQEASRRRKLVRRPMPKTWRKVRVDRPIMPPLRRPTNGSPCEFENFFRDQAPKNSPLRPGYYVGRAPGGQFHWLPQPPRDKFGPENASRLLHFGNLNYDTADAMFDETYIRRYDQEVEKRGHASKIARIGKAHLFLGSLKATEEKSRKINNYGAMFSLLSKHTVDNEMPPGWNRTKPWALQHYKLEIMNDKSSEVTVERWLALFEKYYGEAMSQLQRRRPVLVHCYQGVSRSATLVVAIVMKAFGMTMQQALVYVRHRRPVINPKFMKALQAWENQLRSEGIIATPKKRGLLWRILFGNTECNTC